MRRKSHHQAFVDACKIAGESKKMGGQSAMSMILQVSRQSVNHYHLSGQRVPQAWCPLIEEATGIRCEKLRPDVAWHVLRKQ